MNKDKVADLIINHDKIKSAFADYEKPKKKRTSQFHFVLNTNISYKELKSKGKDHIQKIYNILENSTNYFKNNINKFLKCDIDDSSKKNLISFHTSVEVGKKNAFLHIDGWAFFDSYCLFDSKKVHKYYNERLKEYSKGVYFNVKYVPDNIARIKEYSQKDGMPLVSL